MENLSNSTSRNKLREQFVQNLNGSSIGDITSFLFQVPLFVFITLFIELCILNKININVYTQGSVKPFKAMVVFVLEFFCIVVPLVFMFTLLSDSAQIMFLCIAAMIFAVIIFGVSSPEESVMYWKLPNFKELLFSESEYLGKQPYITYFRSLTFIVTTISILGVDFHVFPRRFAKTETYGVSLMDVGVGLFVFANAIVVNTSALLAKEFKNTLLEGLVLLVLGVIRYYMVQHLDYQKHITEYGMHWNFFITLALLKVVSHVLLKLCKGYSLVIGVILMLIHQFALNYKLEQYVMSDLARNGWISANREGIVSLCGYISLYLFGITIGNLIKPAGSQQPFTRGKLMKLALLSITSLISFAVLYWLNSTQFEVSRRLANMPYVMWVIALGIALLAITLMVELTASWILPVQQGLRSKVYLMMTPAVLESINYNGLAFFSNL